MCGTLLGGTEGRALAPAASWTVDFEDDPKGGPLWSLCNEEGRPRLCQGSHVESEPYWVPSHADPLPYTEAANPHTDSDLEMLQIASRNAMVLILQKSGLQPPLSLLKFPFP